VSLCGREKERQRGCVRGSEMERDRVMNRGRATECACV